MRQQCSNGSDSWLAAHHRSARHRWPVAATWPMQLGWHRPSPARGRWPARASAWSGRASCGSICADFGDQVLILFSILYSTAGYNLEYNIDIGGKLVRELGENTQAPVKQRLSWSLSLGAISAVLVDRLAGGLIPPGSPSWKEAGAALYRDTAYACASLALHHDVPL